MRKTVAELLGESRVGLPRFEPGEAFSEIAAGALLIDLRSADERECHGVIPGAWHVPRSVLEWRVDPDCAYRNPAIARVEARLILFCAEGYSSSLAAASLRQLGFVDAGDLIGGFAAWKAAGLPVRSARREEVASERPGMGPPD
jgi:rhodanese-related sulfurtransferase